MLDSNSSISEYYIRKTCPVCQNNLGDGLGVKFLNCMNCGLMVRRRIDDGKILYKSGWKTPFENLNQTGGLSRPWVKTMPESW
jgi:hypothetical protein